MVVALDIVLGLVLLGFVVHGWRVGFLGSLGVLVGLVAGGCAAALLAPSLGRLVLDGIDPSVVVLVGSGLLVLIGGAIGAGAGARLGRSVHRTALAPVDRVLGSSAQLLAGALLLSVLASIAVSQQVPGLRDPIAGSTVLRTIAAATPAPVAHVLAQVPTALGSGDSANRPG